MNEEKKKKKNRKQKENLVQLGLMDERDNVVDFFYITYAQRTIFISWRSHRKRQHRNRHQIIQKVK